MCKEVAGYSGETIILKDGKFQYWFYSDVVTGKEPQYPLMGTYQISGNTLTLDHPRIYSPKRTIALVNGVYVLWREDGLSLWQEQARIHPYAVLIRMDGLTGATPPNGRPSLELLKSPELKDRDQKK